MARQPESGDGHPLPHYRWWQAFSRSLFHLPLSGAASEQETWSVDVRHGGDSNGIVWAQLYRNGVSHARSRLPAAFPVPGGTIEVATSMYGLKRCHYVTEREGARVLLPDPASAEGVRARIGRTHPFASRVIGAVSILILLVALVVGVPQILEDITRIPPVADAVGTFVSPIRLPDAANITLLVATIVASTERALRLRYSRILDGGLFDGDD